MDANKIQEKVFKLKRKNMKKVLPMGPMNGKNYYQWPLKNHPRNPFFLSGALSTSLNFVVCIFFSFFFSSFDFPLNFFFSSLSFLP